jgi:hypothetical protein
MPNECGMLNDAVGVTKEAGLIADIQILVL